MNTEVVNSAGNFIAPAVEEKILTNRDENPKLIWEKKNKTISQRFTPADLWNIRRKMRGYKKY